MIAQLRQPALNNKQKWVLGLFFLNRSVRESCSLLHAVVTNHKRQKKLRVFRIFFQLNRQAEALAENHTGKPFL